MIKLRKDKWERPKLEEIMGFKNGFNFNKGRLENGWKVLGVSDFQDYFYPAYENLEILYSDKLPSKEYLLENNDIVFVRSNGNRELVGRTILIKEPPFPITFSAFCIRGRFIKASVNPLFFTFYSKSDLFKTSLRKLVQGTNITNVSQGLLSKIEIPLPPLSEQKQIATLFQSIEMAIEHVDEQESNLKVLRKLLINKLTKENPKFGNFITGKCKNVNIGNVSVESSDRVDNPSQSEFKKFIGLEDFERGELVIDKYSSAEKLVSAMKLFKTDDVLFARRNIYLKRVSHAKFDGICSGDVIVMKANKESILPEYLTLVLNTNEFWDYALSNAAGAFSKRIKWRELEVYSFELPDLKTQERILEVFTQLQTTLQQLKQQKTTLRNLKQKLLNEILG